MTSPGQTGQTNSPRNTAFDQSLNVTSPSTNGQTSSPKFTTQKTTSGQFANLTSPGETDRKTGPDCETGFTTFSPSDHRNTSAKMRANLSCPEISFSGKQSSRKDSKTKSVVDLQTLQDSTVTSALDPSRLSSHCSRAQSEVERMRHCSDFTIPRDLSLLSLETTQTGVFRSNLGSGINSQAAEKETGQVGNQTVSPGKLSDRLSTTLSTSVLDSMGDQSMYGGSGIGVSDTHFTDAQKLARNDRESDTSLRSDGSTNQMRVSPNKSQHLLSATLSASFIQGLGDQSVRMDNVSMVTGDQSLQDISQSLIKDHETKQEMKKTLDSLKKVIVR